MKAGLAALRLLTAKLFTTILFTTTFFTRTLFTTTFLAITSLSAFAAGMNITGAGATFPAPVYAKWAAAYFDETGDKVNYQGIGSSGGVNQINARTIDFGATDAPLSDERLEQNDLFQFPTVIGGIVLAVNIRGINSGELTLDGKTLADIYLGKILYWNDPAIAKLNPHLTLPKQNIAVIRRSDGSGTTFVFSSYLAKSSQEWRDHVGVGSNIKWPTGIGGKGNDGISAFVQRIPGAIGYVEYAYVKQANLNYTHLISADGETVKPSRQSFSNAALGADWQSSFAQDLTNQHGANVWPITSTTFILLHKQQRNPERGKAVLKFFEWAYEKGSDLTEDLGYAPLPREVSDYVHQAWQDNIKDSSGNLLLN